MDKASRGDGIPVELFQILKDDAVKVLHSICQQIWKTQQWPQAWKSSVFIQIPKWALGSIITNKASGGDGTPVDLFQILKDDAVKVLHSICQQIWKTQQWPQDGKRSVFIPIPKKGNAKECSNYHTIGTHLTR